jgi:hypothetical protein
VVPDGTGQVAEGVARQQSLQSRSLEPVEKRSVSDFLPTNSLALSGEVLQVLRIGMHDVEMGGPGGENGLLRLSRQPAAKLVFRLISQPVAASGPGECTQGAAAFRLLQRTDRTRRSRNAAAGTGGDALPGDLSPAPASIGASAPMEHGARQR